MTKQAEDVLKAAMQLDADSRVELADRLFCTLSQPERDAIERSWAEECERRLADRDAGRVVPIPGDQVIAEARRKLNR